MLSIGLGIARTRRRANLDDGLMTLDFDAGTFRAGGVTYGSTTEFAVATGSTFSRAGSAYETVAGALVARGTNVMRIAEGFAYEPAGTNLQVQSQALGTTWSAASATVASNTVVAPDGTTTADTTAGTQPYHGVAHWGSKSVTSGASYTFSAYAKVISGTGHGQLVVSEDAFGTGAGDRSVHFQIGDVPYLANFSEATDFGQENLSNGWVRIWVTFTATATAADVTPLLYQGEAEAQTVAWWGVQWEVGPLTSYIPTTTAAANRAADVLTLALPDGTTTVWIEYEDGSFGVHSASGAWVVPTGSKRIAAIANHNIIPALAAPAADSLVEKYGINNHLSWEGTYDTLYASKLLPAVEDLGVRYMRDTVDLGLAAPWIARVDDMVDLGIKFTFICGGVPATDKGALDALPLASVWAVEGMNEPADATAAATAASRIATLKGLLDADSDYSSTVVLGPSYITAPTVAAGGDLSSVIDYVNSHPYPGASLPEGTFRATTLDRDDDVMPGGPWVMTETGYHDNQTSTGFLGVSETASAIYGPRLFLTAATDTVRPVAKAFFHELLDHDAGGGGTDPEGHFGLLDSAGDPKPVYDAFQDLLTAMADPGNSTAGTLHVALSGANDDVEVRAFRRADGVYDIAIWNAVSVYDEPGDEDLVVDPVEETITLAPGWGMARLRRINDASPAWVGVDIEDDTVTLDVTPGVSILRLWPTSAIDADALAYSEAMDTPLTSARLTDIDALVVGLKAAGVWSKLDWLLLLANETSQGSRVNLRNPAKVATAVNAPTFTADLGWTGNGTSSYLDCGEALAAQSNYTLNAAHFGFVVNQQNTTGAVSPVGLVTQQATTHQVRGDGSNATFFVNDATADVAQAALASKLGHFMGVRDGASSKKSYKNGALTNTYTTAATTVGTGNICVLRRTTLYTPDRVAAMHLGGALNAGEVAAISSLLLAYLTAIGAQP